MPESCAFAVMHWWKVFEKTGHIGITGKLEYLDP